MRIALFGSTGSIGTSALSVLQQQFKIQALSSHSQLTELCNQAEIYKPNRLILANREDANQVKQKTECSEVLYGQEGLKIAATNEDTDCLINAIAGPSGLLPTFWALQSGKKVLLANKESLVSGGALLMETARQNSTSIVPIDSEHNAILRCLPQDYVIGEDVSNYGVQTIWLTASGGPFLDYSADQLKQVQPAEACSHPIWSMGAKISVDSATLMNKGLELIEAHFLFGIDSNNIKVVIHPQSMIHCMVEYCDGSFIAQLSRPDMKLAIHQALHYPHYKPYDIERISPLNMQDLSFQSPDEEKFPCLRLAREAAKQKGAPLIVLNAADNVAVESFLAGQISFQDIAIIVQKTMQQFADYDAPKTIEDIIHLDKQSTNYATQLTGL